MDTITVMGYRKTAHFVKDLFSYFLSSSFVSVAEVRYGVLAFMA